MTGVPNQPSFNVRYGRESDSELPVRYRNRCRGGIPRTVTFIAR